MDVFKEKDISIKADYQKVPSDKLICLASIHSCQEACSAKTWSLVSLFSLCHQTMNEREHIRKSSKNAKH